MMNTARQNSKFHICLVTGEFPALTETFITTKALELSRLGHRITIIKNEESGNINASHLAQVKASNIEVLSFADVASFRGFCKAVFQNPLVLLKSISPNSSAFKKKYKATQQCALLQKHPFDIIHFEFSGLAVAYMDAINKVNCKIVVSCRGTAEKVKLISEPGRALKLTKLFSMVDAVHCVSADMAKTIKPYCTNDKKIFINRPAIDAAVFKRTKTYGRMSSEVTILSIGRLTFQKGYLTGLLALRQLKLEGVNCKWLIVGDGASKEELLFHIFTLQLQDCVELLGKKSRDEILDLYNEADIFLLPSVYEGIANVCLEAMSMELPVVSTKSGGMEEVIVHRTNGLLCDVYDHALIAAHLKLLSENFGLAQSLGRNARKTVIENFTIERQTKVFEEQYKRIANNLTLVKEFPSCEVVKFNA